MSKLRMSIFIFIFCLNNVITSAKILNLEDIKIDSLVRRLGYSLETHTVVTNDSFILTLHRLRSPRIRENNFRPPVLLMHGLTGSSTDWLVTGNTGLAIMLYKKGYDVWMGNTRSSPFSKMKSSDTDVTYSRKDLKDYSWHEMGMFDIPKIINKVLEVTQRNRIFYVGYSQGATEFFVLTSMFPEYNDKVHLMISLAPAVYTGNVNNIMRLMLLIITYPLTLLTEKIGHVPFATSPLTLFTSQFCNTDSVILQIICLLIPLLNTKGDEMKYGILPKYFFYTPIASSSKQFLHYSQLVYRPDKFQLYDYGTEKNQLIYNTPEPPTYPLERVDAPVYIFHGTTDSVVIPRSIELLKSNIRNCVGVSTMNNFNHIDFIYGKDRMQLNLQIIRTMRDFNIKHR